MTATAREDFGSVALEDGEVVSTILESVEVGFPIGVIAIERPADPPSLIQEWCNRADLSRRIPYWAEIWPASRAIAARLASSADLDSHRVMDLGCGLGLAGVAAGLRGARVTFVDHHPDAVLFARRNAMRAGIQRPEFLLADWRDPTWARPCDVVLGADLLYDREEHEPLCELLERLLIGGGSALLADPRRDSAAPFIEAWRSGGRRAGTTDLGIVPGADVAVALHELRLG